MSSGALGDLETLLNSTEPASVAVRIGESLGLNHGPPLSPDSAQPWTSSWILVVRTL